MEMDYKDDAIVRIADKDIRTYLGQCDKKFNKYQKIVLSFGESFAEKGRNIASILGAIGIKIHDSNLNKFSGNIKFEGEENVILNKKTGRREKRLFYQLNLTKVEGLEIDNIKDYEFAELSDSRAINEDISNKNELKISDNVLDFYLGQCNLDFQSYDQLILSTTTENIEMLKYLIKILNPLGIEIDDEYIDRENKKIYFSSIERERINPKTGRKERKVFYKLGLTKVPELFMYTNPKTAVRVEGE